MYRYHSPLIQMYQENWPLSEWKETKTQKEKQFVYKWNLNTHIQCSVILCEFIYVDLVLTKHELGTDVPKMMNYNKL